MENHRILGQLGRGDCGSVEPYDPPMFSSTLAAIARHVDADHRLTVDTALHRYLISQATQRPRLSEHLNGKGIASGYFPQGHPAGHIAPPSQHLQRAQWPAFESRFPISDAPVIGLKRPSGEFEEFAHRQKFPGSDGNSRQDEAPVSKRARIDGTDSSDLPVHPQRPGQKDCAYYMATRTCEFGAACKFDHPVWVPAGGIPDWNAVPSFPSGGDSLPVRPGEPDCRFYMQTGTCKFGWKCKFSHPRDRPEAQKADGIDRNADESAVSLPERPGEPECAFFLRTGNCRFGANCKFSHPKDGSGGIIEARKAGNLMAVKPATMENSKGLPIRPGEMDCPFYVKTGSCKYGRICRFSHPCGVGFPVQQGAAKLSLAGLPRRDGVPACPFYMKTGACKFGENCKFDHPPPSEAVARVVADIDKNDATASDDETS